jgi:mannose-6-phosphate isomerase-like protein (cupin superfamily)
MSKKARRFIHIDDVEFIGNVDVHGEPRDEGVFKRLISEETGSNDISLGIGWLKPGEVHILHHHPKASEFYYVIEGSSEIMVDDETRQATTGMAVYMPAGAKHKIVNNTDKTCTILFGYNCPQDASIWDE